MEQNWGIPKLQNGQIQPEPGCQNEGELEPGITPMGHLPREDEPIHNHVPERRLPKQSCGEHQQGVKPGNKSNKEIVKKKQTNRKGDQIQANTVDLLN